MTAKFIAWIVVLMGVAVVVLGNAHLVYVSFASDPDCVVTNFDFEKADRNYRPVKSGC